MAGMHAYSRQGRSFGSIISVDQWVGVGDDTPPMVQRQLEDDLDYALGMPELISFRHNERRAAEDVAIEEVEGSSSDGSRQGSTPDILHKSRRISDRLAELGRKAKSFASFLGRKDSLLKDGDRTMMSMHGPVTVNELARLAPQTQPFDSESAQFGDAASDDFEQWSVDILHHNEADTRLALFDDHELLAARIREGEARGQFRDDIRQAIFEARIIETTEEEQWDASYDLMKTSAERCRQFDESFEQGLAPMVDDDNEDVDLDNLPFEIDTLC
ncbi:hypothetical protein AMS68_003627 [Peltaster fructicola]|uniref:Uncharacterized protein n=1 Tax=Peltaster fructicola TaxID=286661 RepID=A0A6H0XUI1_9PEZI|nr:hypothetical protein AMS68_003627 [Peltaster fructicola]